MEYSDDIRFCVAHLKKKGIGITEIQQMMALADDIDADFELIKVQFNDFDSLAKKLRELWPPGDKEVMYQGRLQKYPWRDSVDSISKRLQFIWGERFKGKEVDEEECLTIARRYLSRFEGNTRYMQLLKYFIFKKDEVVDKKGVFHYTYKSTFADMLEGKNDEDAIQNEWESLIGDTNAGEGNLI